MRIVYTVLNGEVAGGQLVCLQCMRAALGAGHTVLLVSPTDGSFTDMARAVGIPVSLIPLNRLFYIHGAARLARLLLKWNADLVHCHSAVAGSVLARTAATIAGVPIITHVHSRNY